MVFLWFSYSKPMNIALKWAFRWPFVGPRARIPNLAQNQVMKRSEVGLGSNGGKSCFFQTGLVGGLEHECYCSIYWEQSSQLTNSIIFQRG